MRGGSREHPDCLFGRRGSTPRPRSNSQKRVFCQQTVVGQELLLFDSTVVIVGMGEVGRPLERILSRTFNCVAVDMEPVEVAKSCDVLHICYPFQIANFVETTVDYVHKYEPTLTVINST